MKRSSLALLVPTALVLALGFAPAAGAQATAKVTCKDGTTSTAAGRGACSAHGGVAPAKAMKVAAKADKAADKAAAKTDKAAAKSAAKADKAADKSAAKSEKMATKSAKGSEKAAAKAEKAADKAAPKGAVTASAEVSAKCKDGTMSKSKSRRGACSGHGGVATWMK